MMKNYNNMGRYSWCVINKRQRNKKKKKKNKKIFFTFKTNSWNVLKYQMLNGNFKILNLKN